MRLEQATFSVALSCFVFYTFAWQELPGYLKYTVVSLFSAQVFMLVVLFLLVSLFVFVWGNIELFLTQARLCIIDLDARPRASGGAAS